MSKEDFITKQFKHYINAIDGEIKTLLNLQDSLDLYDMSNYSFGFKDGSMVSINGSVGKHFRSCLCLLLADAFDNNNNNKLLEIAAAIEIFHNFTLIHDDVEDHDELRRGRETIWRKFGTEQAINTGDVHLMLTFMEIDKAIIKHGLYSDDVLGFMNRRFLKVSEGQYLDLLFSKCQFDDKRVSRQNYMKMITNKSAILVSLASSVVGKTLGLSDLIITVLDNYGINLGLAYQIWDDAVSLWGNEQMSGKARSNDLYEKKKTLPILYLYEKADPSERNELNMIYKSTDPLEKKGIDIIYKLLDKYKIKANIKEEIDYYIDKTNKGIKEMPISDTNKEKLFKINQSLFFEGKMTL